MSETKKRNVHLPEFKAKVGLEAVRGVMTINEIGQGIRVAHHHLGAQFVALQNQQHQNTHVHRRSNQISRAPAVQATD